MRVSPAGKTQFTEEDAIALVTLIRRAPLANMDEADAVRQLLDRFAAFINAHFNEVLPDSEG